MPAKILTQKGHHFLWIDDYLWMWDIPKEVEIQRGIAEKAYGDVLVVGYGLGVVQGHLVRNPRVRSITTVEIDTSVVMECLRVFGMTYGLVMIEDFYDRPDNFKYDTIIGDHWFEIVPESLPEYCKFKIKAEQLLREDGLILGWGSDYFEYLIKKDEL